MLVSVGLIIYLIHEPEKIMLFLFLVCILVYILFFLICHKQDATQLMYFLNI